MERSRCQALRPSFSFRQRPGNRLGFISSVVVTVLFGGLGPLLGGAGLAFAGERSARQPTDFIPDGYVVFEASKGDLNKDGREDHVFVIKGTDKSQWVSDEYRGDLDRNRRGLIIAFAEGDEYRLALRNLDCFSSDQEDGGVYFPPDLAVAVQKGNLVVSYLHGRYGYWSYTFRYQHGGFELIGYDDSENFGPIIKRQTSINFSTARMLTRENVNPDDDGGKERFEEHWSSFKRARFIQLADIRDFDGLHKTALLARVK
ncbi:hypothetical protein [Pseudomonas sp. Marseille-QA0892]